MNCYQIESFTNDRWIVRDHFTTVQNGLTPKQRAINVLRNIKKGQNDRSIQWRLTRLS